MCKSNLINYNAFKKILNDRLFEGSRLSLIENIANNPDRFIGLFRPTKPKTKLIQNLTQSHEIKFGDALEEVFSKYLSIDGYNLLPKIIKNSTNGDILNIDQLFSKDNKVYMIEQKVRDDHDSTKKRGQFQNFENKYFEISKIYANKKIMPIMWFIDNSLVKNKNYYLNEIQRMNTDYGCEAKLCYGNELFNNTIIDGVNSYIWQEILEYLKEWKNELPDMPEINFDVCSNDVFDEIKDLRPSAFRRLFENQEIASQILPIIFPSGDTLRKLIDYFKTKDLPIYANLIIKIETFLNKKN